MLRCLVPFYFITICLTAIIAPVDVYASSTIWCNPANTGAEDGISKNTGYNTLYEAILAMSAGDTIIIANGNWSDYPDMAISNADGGHWLPPSGTSFSNMSKIIAETDWGVQINGISDNGTGGIEFVLIRGIIVKNHFSGLYGWKNSKIIRCGFMGPKVSGNVATFSLSGPTENNLVEECIAWGGGRYKFLDYHGHHNIFRRCVARHDWYISPEWEGQESNFRGYGGHDNVWQNCISIDSDREEYQTTGSKEDGDFWVGDQSGAGGNVIDGCIVIKGLYQAYYVGGQSGGSQTLEIRNSLAIGPSLVGAQYLTGGMTWGEITVTANNLALINFDSSYQHLISHNKDSGGLALNSSLFRDSGHINGGVLDYNYYYNTGTGSYGGHSVNADPLTNGYRYPVRIEAGSPLSTAGKNGGICGPTILKKIGVAGTAYGETGWDTVTDEDLWPFPNEVKIKELMSESVEGVSGEYGFCTGNSKDGSPQTLTKYIWEYLGNQIPDDIYGNKRPAQIQSLKIVDN